MTRPLHELASRILITAARDTTAAQAALLMRQHHVGSLVVMEGERPAGIVTDRDLVLGVMAEELDARLFTVGDIMSTELVGLDGAASVLDAIALMRQKRLRRLLVNDAAGRVVGVLTLEDVLEALASEFAQLALGLREARDRERAQRR